ncbi:LysR family transcriptional regulator [Pseudomonas sp. Q11]|uniref:LysR family transcriptional regulator n=1 Tax=Pseudomonas sp. Q11 TaxID=2968470 RepID=UPI00210D4CD0|nr:LysR family transcriptional regulator [Pseudomonas sp. Q11]MCQ6255358.1 LysR family transcriptional regulator [Pseudomonas sp. Q11]
MDWNDLRVFLAIVRTGSLGAAAKQLGVSHPTVGRRLHVLEQDGGQVFFRRTSQGLVLTDSGEKILYLAEEMERSALSIERHLGGNDQPEGLLRISSADWFACYVLAPVLTELSRRYPKIVPEVIPGHRLFDLTRRDADIAFRIVPFTEPDIVQRRLTTLSYGLYAAADLPFSPSQNGEDLGLILMSTAQAHYPDVLWLQQMFPRAKTVLTSSSRTVQAQMCGRGLGVAVLPRALGDQLTALRLVDVGSEPPGRDIWMGYHHDMRQMDRLRALADLAGEMIGT